MVTRAFPSACRIAKFSNHVPLGNSMICVELRLVAARFTILDSLGGVVGMAFETANRKQSSFKKVRWEDIFELR